MARKGQAIADGRLAGRASLEAQARKFQEAVERKARRARAKEALEKAKDALSDEEIKALLRPTAEEIESFKRVVMSGQKNSLAMAGGMRVMLEYTLEKPQQKVGVESVQVVVGDLPKVEDAKRYELPAAGTTVAVPVRGEDA